MILIGLRRLVQRDQTFPRPCRWLYSALHSIFNVCFVCLTNYSNKIKEFFQKKSECSFHLTRRCFKTFCSRQQAIWTTPAEKQKTSFGGYCKKVSLSSGVLLMYVRKAWDTPRTLPSRSFSNWWSKRFFLDINCYYSALPFSANSFPFSLYHFCEMIR